MYRVGPVAIVLFILIIALFQATGLHYLAIDGIIPDILLIAVVFFALYASGKNALIAALTAGLLKDMTSSVVMGSYLMTFCMAAVLLNAHKSKFYKESVFTQIVLVSVTYILTGIMALFLNVAVAKDFVFHHSFIGIILKAAIYTGLLSPLVFLLIPGRSHRRLLYSS